MSSTPDTGGTHGAGAPSEWVMRWAGEIAPGGEVLDLACGGGRHSRYLASLALRVCAMDRDAQALGTLDGIVGVTTRQADLETGSWPLRGVKFEGIVVTNYLHRPLFPHILEALAPGGVLIYETFAQGNERFGKPSHPDFLLRQGELIEVARGALRVIAYEDVELGKPRPACIQRICARRASGEA